MGEVREGGGFAVQIEAPLASGGILGREGGPDLIHDANHPFFRNHRPF